MRDEKIFPDGSTIDSWFYKADEFYVEDTSKKFLITEYGIKDDGKVYTEEFQALIDIYAPFNFNRRCVGRLFPTDDIY